MKDWIEPSAKAGEITCFDNLYFASDQGEEVREVFRTEGGESIRDASFPHRSDFPFYSLLCLVEYGAWWTVGRHAHWNADLKKLSIDILREVLLLPPGKSVPNVSRVSFSPLRSLFSLANE